LDSVWGFNAEFGSQLFQGRIVFLEQLFNDAFLEASAMKRGSS
jgi:hypothetical protein